MDQSGPAGVRERDACARLRALSGKIGVTHAAWEYLRSSKVRRVGPRVSIGSMSEALREGCRHALLAMVEVVR